MGANSVRVQIFLLAMILGFIGGFAWAGSAGWLMAPAKSFCAGTLGYDLPYPGLN